MGNVQRVAPRKMHNSQEQPRVVTGVANQIQLSIAKDAIPLFKKPCPVSYALRGAETGEFSDPEKTNFSHWAPPIVTILKPDGSVRICSEYKVTINPVLEIELKIFLQLLP